MVRERRLVRRPKVALAGGAVAGAGMSRTLGRAVMVNWKWAAGTASWPCSLVARDVGRVAVDRINRAAGPDRCPCHVTSARCRAGCSRRRCLGRPRDRGRWWCHPSDIGAQSGPESSVPIASLTKMTTAVVILRDHPLPAGSDGPGITVTPADAAEYQTELHNDESSIAIQAGETLTERQMLEAMLTQSANDIAFSLAMWDAGSIPAFVAKMNALATSLGTTGTHYVDASGYDPQTVSTASDVLRIAAAGMAIPAFAQTVALTSVDLPLVGTLHNIVSEIGVNGVVGIKSGYTSSAGACMVLAAYRTVQDRDVLVLVAVLGQPTPPPSAPKPADHDDRPRYRSHHDPATRRPRRRRRRRQARRRPPRRRPPRRSRSTTCRSPIRSSTPGPPPTPSWPPPGRR